MARLRKRFYILLILLACFSCGRDDSSENPAGDSPVQDPPTLKPVAALEAFGSHEEFLHTLETMAKQREDHRKNSVNTGPANAEDEAADSAPTNDTITNNQESGVDEGGIVKNIGDYLMILRQGRLYAVHVASTPVQTDSLAVAADEQLNQNVWYDEMLVKGDLIYVIGYRYTTLANPNDCRGSNIGATEITSFRLIAGKLTRLSSLFIESNDYFSGSNYASRMIDGKINLYMPKSAFDYCYYEGKFDPKIPRFLDYSSENGFSAGAPILDGTQVMKNIEELEFPVFHTYMQCELLDDGSFACESRSFLAGWSGIRFVNAEDAFSFGQKAIYRFNLANLSLSAHGILGYPRDRFSFKTIDDSLKVLVARANREPRADEVSASTSSTSNSYPYKFSIGLMGIPLNEFSDRIDQDLSALFQPLLEDENGLYVEQNRFIGEHILFATSGPQQSNLHSLDLSTMNLNSLPLSLENSYMTRLETLGTNGFAVFSSYDSSTNSSQLTLAQIDPSALSLDNSLVLAGTAEGETRSHGYFAKAQDDGSHLLALPIIDTQGGSYWWGNGVSNLAFLRSDRNGLTLAGQLSSSGDTTVCETSCIDWYGNTRPIFLRDHIFGLMGNELSPAVITDGSVGKLGESLFLTPVVSEN